MIDTRKRLLGEEDLSMLASVASFVSILNGQCRHEKVTALMVKCFKLGRQVRCPHLMYTSRSLEVLYELRSEHKFSVTSKHAYAA